MTGWSHSVCVKSCVGFVCLWGSGCLGDERVKHMCLCGGLPFWCRSQLCFVLFHAEVFVCVMRRKLLCQILGFLLSGVAFFFSLSIYFSVCVDTLLCVVCSPWGSGSMLVAWDTYDQFYGSLSSSECFDLFMCLHEVSVMRSGGSASTALPFKGLT